MKYIFIASVILIIVILLIKYTNRNDIGKQGEKAVGKLLKKQKGKLINSLRLPLYDSITEIDHVLITSKGIFVVETKNISGKITGRINDKELVHNIGSKTHSLYNPVLQNRTHCDNLVHHLKKGGYYPVPIYSVVCFSSDDIIFDIEGKFDTVILKKETLCRYIASVQKSQEKVAVGSIYKYLRSINQKSMIKFIKHNKDIQKKK